MGEDRKQSDNCQNGAFDPYQKSFFRMNRSNMSPYIRFTIEAAVDPLLHVPKLNISLTPQRPDRLCIRATSDAIAETGNFP